MNKDRIWETPSSWLLFEYQALVCMNIQSLHNGAMLSPQSSLPAFLGTRDGIALKGSGSVI